MLKINHRKQVKRATRQAEVALGMFQTAHDKLDSANERLARVASDAEAKARELLNHAEQAKGEIKANTTVQKKLRDFFKDSQDGEQSV